MVFEHDYIKFPELTNRQLGDFGLTSPHKQIVSDFRAEVVKVHDGDTITLRTDFRDFDFPLRLLDINALELSEGGEESRDWLEGQILHEVVEIRIDPQLRVGKYGRLLGKVEHGGLDVGEQMMNMGLAKPFDQRDEGTIADFDKYMAANGGSI